MSSFSLLYPSYLLAVFTISFLSSELFGHDPSFAFWRLRRGWCAADVARKESFALRRARRPKENLLAAFDPGARVVVMATVRCDGFRPATLFHARLVFPNPTHGLLEPPITTAARSTVACFTLRNRHVEPKHTGCTLVPSKHCVFCLSCNFCQFHLASWEKLFTSSNLSLRHRMIFTRTFLLALRPCPPPH